MVNERLRGPKTGAIDETRKLFGIFIYLWVLLSLFSLHKALILPDLPSRVCSYQCIGLGKGRAAREFFHVGDNLRNRPLIYPIIFKSAVFAVILICFHIIEEALVGVLHGKTFSQSIPSIGGGTVQGILMVGIIMFVVLMPFAFREPDRVIGTEELRSPLFGDETKAGGAPSIMRGRWRTAAAAALAVLVLGGGWLTWSSVSLAAL
jgi:hypothetical protein